MKNNNRKGWCCDMRLTKVLLGVVCILWANSVTAGVYSWIDENGVRHFSDTPTAGTDTKIQVTHEED